MTDHKCAFISYQSTKMPKIPITTRFVKTRISNCDFQKRMMQVLWSSCEAKSIILLKNDNLKWVQTNGAVQIIQIFKNLFQKDRLKLVLTNSAVQIIQKIPFKNDKLKWFQTNSAQWIQ